jgi:hypothetical protein
MYICFVSGIHPNSLFDTQCGKQLGGVLAKISTQAEYDEAAVLIAASAAASKQAWIGLNDIDLEDTFRFVEDNSVLGAFQVSGYTRIAHIHPASTLAPST